MTTRGQLMAQSLDKVYVIALQLLAGLQHLHCHGLIHCDVKPNNLLRMKDGRVCLTDFGITRLLPDGISRSTVGPPNGTAKYMAPELCKAALAGEFACFTPAVSHTQLYPGFLVSVLLASLKP